MSGASLMSVQRTAAWRINPGGPGVFPDVTRRVAGLGVARGPAPAVRRRGGGRVVAD
ncbi:hypothetical protein [Halobaculum gomorrense]|uniref:hypothetical protein n=1 Tax=Halobaculum gomorrense TaxID=43928 RepID=UPI0013566940|nr:hypothetical protein [Halobaculum gomorrense]